MKLVSLYTVPLCTINGLSRLTKLMMIKGAGTADSNRIGWPIQIESRSFAGPYHEGAYLLFPNLFQFVLETVDTFTIDIRLIQFVPVVDNTLGEEILPYIQIDSLFNNIHPRVLC